MHSLTDLYEMNFSKKVNRLRELIFNSFWTFMNIISPHMCWGSCHEDIASFLTNDKASSHQLILIPRAHLKSSIMSHYVAWRILRNPAISILYASATPSLAFLQLDAIKNILVSESMGRYFPELVDPEFVRGDFGKWSRDAFNVTHWKRKESGTRDYTCKATGIGAATTGLHCDILIYDDITVPKTNADPWTSTGREFVERWTSQAASILNPDGDIKVVGTRYHDKDIYSTLLSQVEEVVDEDGNIIESVPVYQVFEKPVEIEGDFLWPRTKSRDGKYYGFNYQVLGKIKAQYSDKEQFYAQYYNDTTDPENRNIDPSLFQYYDREYLFFNGDTWCIKGKPLDIYAALDIAASMRKEADFTALVVVGIDSEGFRYVLDIIRLKTDKISVMSDMIFNAYVKWRFKKLRAETNAQQGLVVKQIQEFLRKDGAIFSWDAVPSRGDKSLRIKSILEPLYSQKILFHYRGGNCSILEDELIASKPAHDDVADALAACNEIIKPKVKRRVSKVSNIKYHPRFGGIA